jgi:hypothetical protein
MLELSLTKILLSQELPLYSNSAAFDEGTPLEYVMGTTQANVGAPVGAGNVVQPGSGTAGAFFAGTALNVFTRPTTMVWVDVLTVSPTTYTATLTQIPTGTTAVAVVLGTPPLGTQLTNITTGSPTTSQVLINGTNNQTLTFNAAAAGSTVTVTYRYNITVLQAEIFVGDGVAAGFSPSTITGTVGCIERGIVFTSNFDTSKYWGAGNITNISLLTGGLYSYGGSGAAVTGTVYQVPTTDIPFLGVYYK